MIGLKINFHQGRDTKHRQSQPTRVNTINLQGVFTKIFIFIPIIILCLLKYQQVIYYYI